MAPQTIKMRFLAAMGRGEFDDGLVVLVPAEEQQSARGSSQASRAALSFCCVPTAKQTRVSVSILLRHPCCDKRYVEFLATCAPQNRMGLPAVFSCTYEVKRLRNLGYSRLATARRTEAGAQPPGFTAHTGG